MKHILNNISQEEKERILEQHKGGKQLFIENFNKLVNNKLGTVNPLVINEQTMMNTTTDTTTKKSLPPIEADRDKIDEIFKKIKEYSGKFNPDQTQIYRQLGWLLPENTSVGDGYENNPKNKLIQAKKNYYYLLEKIKNPKLTGGGRAYDNVEDWVGNIATTVFPTQSSSHGKMVEMARKIDTTLR